MKKLIYEICFLSLLLLAGLAGADTTCCTSPDGTFPPPCPYDHSQPMMITDGLPQETAIVINGPLQGFSGIIRIPGGTLGGEVENFSSQLVMQMTGTGVLTGFNRDITLSVQCETHIGPQTPGAPIQSFPTDFFMLQGQLPIGDPDFDLLRITAGTNFGMPSPGQTTLTRQLDGNWNVDSFFDITYRIDFVGAPGGPLAGMSGSTTGTIRMETGCPADTSGGDDCYNVSCGDSQQDFNSNPIPADFFGPGSDPFDGIIRLGGGDPAGPDTVIHRLSDFSFSGGLPSAPSTVPIEIVSLNLVSCAPITVTGGQNPGLWNVSVSLSQLSPPQGHMTAIKTYANGGTFTATLYVQARFTFTSVNNPSDIRILDTGIEGLPPLQLSTVEPHSWQDTSPKPNPPCEGNGFYPGIESPVQMSSSSGDAILVLESPKPPSPHIAIDGTGWQTTLADGSVSPVDEVNGFDYMEKWHNPNTPHEGSLYPPTMYREPELYVYSDNPCVGNYPDPNNPSPGLVMAWENPTPQPPLNSFSAAWKYKYPVDPDLTNSIITVTVHPPCRSITAVSLGLKDINGNIRAWYWDVNVPGGLPCGVGTAISIDTSIAGLAAATPTAAGYMSDPGFDITQVVEIWFDENAVWMAGTPVPPPGTTTPKAWNYWYDLTVTPKPTTTNNPLKWSQPPVEVDPGRILGWDEKSVKDLPPLMADDWHCKDQRPITDIHWWGSFLGWMDAMLPAQKPIAFHFGIWTDVQPNAANNLKFSHPGKLIWEYTCTDYQWKFVGYDKDPRQVAGAPPLVQDSCFRFDCNLPQAVWYYQKPDPNNNGTIYWLSIAAIYPAGTNSQYPWGWKTRPHFFQDDAVRIKMTDTGSPWPLGLNSNWVNGQPIEYPHGVSWDLAFELTTNDTTVPPPVDFNADGVVNVKDLAVFANYWLTTWP